MTKERQTEYRFDGNLAGKNREKQRENDEGIRANSMIVFRTRRNFIIIFLQNLIVFDF